MSSGSSQVDKDHLEPGMFNLGPVGWPHLKSEVILLVSWVHGVRERKLVLGTTGSRAWTGFPQQAGLGLGLQGFA